MNRLVLLWFTLLILLCASVITASYLISIKILEDSSRAAVCKEDVKRELSEEEVLLSCIINAEASSSDIVDHYLIGSTVLNRMDNHMFPECLEDVVFQAGQYDGISGRFNRSAASDTIACKLIRGLGRNYKVLFFYNYHTATDKAFIRFLDRKYSFITLTQNHKFYGLCETI